MKLMQKLCLFMLPLTGTLYGQVAIKSPTTEKGVATPVVNAFGPNLSFQDNDRDGFDDLWYHTYAFGAEKLEPNEDPDGDGISNLNEMKLFQDPVTWTNYKLPGAAVVAYAASRRAAVVVQTSAGPVSTSSGPATSTAEAQETQKYSERLSSALDFVDRANTDSTAKAAAKMGMKTEATLKGKRSVLAGMDHGRPIRITESDTLSNVQVQVDQLQPGGALSLALDGSPLGLAQTDRSIDLWDGGLPRTTHATLLDAAGTATRIFNLDGSVLNEHATQMACILGGIGALDDGTGNLSTGCAPNAKITAGNFSNDRFKMAGRPLGAARVSNHSYSSAVGWTFTDIGVGFPVLAWVGDIGISTVEAIDFGRYSVVSRDYDSVALGKPYTLQVRSAGNERDPSESPAGWLAAGAFLIAFDGQPNGFYVTTRNGINGLYNGSRFYPFPATPGSFVTATGTPPADGAANFDTQNPLSTSKNMLTVGSVDTAGALTVFSTFGPTDDGRIKPEIVAPGVGVYTASSTGDFDVALSTGTSPSAAIVTGTVALLNQRQEDLWSAKQPLSASTSKALLVHTAQEMGAEGPNYDSGYGMLLAGDAATTVESNFNAQNVDGFGNTIQLRTFIKEVVIPESEWIRIDLAADTATTGADLNWNTDYASGYVIEGSTAAAPDTYVTLATGYGAVGSAETKTWAATTVRYVRLTALTRASASGISLNEITIKNGAAILSLNKPVTASSELSAVQAPAKAVDGNTATRWASVYAGVTEYPWVQIDLGAATAISKAVITWDTAYSSEFYLEGAANQSGPYTQIGTVTSSTGAANTVTFAAVTYRYVRLVAQKQSGASGVSIREFQLYNAANTLLSAAKPVIANSQFSAAQNATKVTDGVITAASRWASIPSGNPGARFALRAVGGPIRATTTWTDAPGAVSPNAVDNSLSNLTNDLDTRIFRNTASGVRTETKPWILNPLVPTAVSTRGDNFRDNLEQIETTSAVSNAAYTYELRPKMNRRIVGRQRVSIVFSGVQQIPVTLFQLLSYTYVFDTPNNQVADTLTWTSVPGETYRVQWSTDLVTWTDVPGDISAVGDTTTTTFRVSPIPSSLFERVLTVPTNPFNVP